MSQVKFLDCTLRDGGYVNNWKFGRETIRDMIRRFSSSGVDIIECGFLTDLPSDPDQSLFHSVEEINALLPENSQSLFVAMIAIGEKEINPALLSDAAETGLGGIRLTFHPDEIDKAFCYGEMIQRKGYRLFMQPVGTAGYTDEELIRLIKRVNQLNPYAFYLVDTLGTMYGKLLLRQVILADNNLAPGIRIGYHSHNNLQMSFANAQKLLEFKTDRGMIIDCSASGMGRGAGNLCTELVLNYYNNEFENRYHVLPVLEVVDKYITAISLTSRWGYSCPYFLAASQDCHPNYASYLIDRQTLTMKDIEKIIQSIPQDYKVLYDRRLIERLYSRFQSRKIDDSAAVDTVSRDIAGRRLLLLAPGATLTSEYEQILAFIQREHPYVVSVNFADSRFPIDACFVSNHKRMDIIGQELRSLRDIRLILTSNLAGSGRENCLYVETATRAGRTRSRTTRGSCFSSSCTAAAHRRSGWRGLTALTQAHRSSTTAER